MSHPLPSGGLPAGYATGVPAQPPPRRGGGGTAITAAVLSLLGTPWHALLSAAAVWAIAHEVLHFHAGDAWLVVLGVVATLLKLSELLLLLVGGIQLLRHRPAGRVMIVWGCSIILVLAAVGLMAFTLGLGRLEKPLLAIPVPFAIATLVLVLLPSTNLWCQRPGQSAS